MKRTRTPILMLFFYLLFTLSGYSQFVKKSVQESQIYNGSTDVNDVYSPALEGNLQGNPSTQPVKVYLPPHYENFPNNKYPVVYLLHAGLSDYNDYYTYYDILNTLNQLISNKSIVPLVIVTPNADTKYGGSCYTNSYVSGNWEDYIVQDLIQYIESEYLVLDQPNSRGLSGFSLGGYGTAKLAMKHPSLFNSIGLIGPGLLDFEEEMLNTPSWKEAIIAASSMDNYDPNASWQTRMAFAYAVAFAPDSSLNPTSGRFPFTADGVLIDSIWQKYLVHDPGTMLQTHRDSLLKINNIQFYVGDQDIFTAYGCEPFHQSLLDNGIEHGYKIYSGGHNPGPVIDDILIYFSESLVSHVPTIRLLSEDSLIVGDTLVLKSDMNGSIYIVPDADYQSIDSIIKYQVITADVLADEEKEVYLSDIESGAYHVYAISTDNMVSNIPEGFSIIPTTIENKKIPTYKIYPNPVNDRLNIKTNNPGYSFLLVSSIKGQLILSQEIEGASHQIDLSPFQKGIYFITIRSKDFVTTKKIIKL